LVISQLFALHVLELSWRGVVISDPVNTQRINQSPANANAPVRAMLNNQTLDHRPLDSRCNLFAD